MGASNALAAYHTWAGKIPTTSLTCLVYMALVSKDSDEHPWYGGGSEALAEFALGRKAPVTKTDLRAVERALTPLHASGAIETDRPGAVRRSGPSTARYRLILNARRFSSGVQWIGEPSKDPPHPTKNGADTRRFSDAHPTKSGTHTRRKTSDRGEGGDMEERQNQEENSSNTAPHPPRATGREQAEGEENPNTNGTAPPAGNRCPKHPAMPTSRRGGCPVCRAQGAAA